MRLALWCSAACTALALLAAPAKADIIYTFTSQVSEWPNEPGGSMQHNGLYYGAGAHLILSDAAATEGFSLDLKVNGGPTHYNAKNVIEMVFTLPGVTGGAWTISSLLAADAPGRSSVATHSINLKGDGSSISGNLTLNDTNHWLQLVVNGLSYNGNFASDAGLGCFNGCLVAGEITKVVTPIPEPASMALFGVGLAGLGFLRARRKERAA